MILFMCSFFNFIHATCNKVNMFIQLRIESSHLTAAIKIQNTAKEYHEIFTF